MKIFLFIASIVATIVVLYIGANIYYRDSTDYGYPSSIAQKAKAYSVSDNTLITVNEWEYYFNPLLSYDDNALLYIDMKTDEGKNANGYLEALPTFQNFFAVFKPNINAYGNGEYFTAAGEPLGVVLSNITSIIASFPDSKLEFLSTKFIPYKTPPENKLQNVFISYVYGDGYFIIFSYKNDSIDGTIEIYPSLFSNFPPLKTTIPKENLQLLKAYLDLVKLKNYGYERQFDTVGDFFYNYGLDIFIDESNKPNEKSLLLNEFFLNFPTEIKIYNAYSLNENYKIDVTSLTKIQTLSSNENTGEVYLINIYETSKGEMVISFEENFIIHELYMVISDELSKELKDIL